MSSEQGFLRECVLRAALANGDEALAAWNQALAIAPIDVWANELARPLPLVYLNLRSRAGMQHEQLLKGIYRAAWASNMLRLRSAIDVMHDFDSAHVPYRLIKGGAVCAITADWGARRMGDLDVVFASNHQEQVARILTKRGFSQRIASRSIDGLWENQGAGRLDLHGVDMRDPSRRWVLDEPGQRIDALTYPIHVPSREVTITLATHHALTGLADSDYVQGQLDVARLMHHADVERLAQLVSPMREQDQMLEFFQELGNLGALPDAPVLITRIRSSHRRFAARDARHRTRRRLQRMLLVLRERRRSVVQLVRDCPQLLGRPVYLAWLSAAQMRPVESWWLRRFGGFLPRPVQTFPINQTVAIEFTSKVSATPLYSSINVPGVEDRFRVRVATSKSFRMTLGVMGSEATVVRLVFVNGWLHGYLPVDGFPSARIDSTSASGSVEISLRLASDAGTSSSGVTVRLEGPLE